MFTHRKSNGCSWLGVAMLAFCLCSPVTFAQELTVDTYIDLSLARLSFVASQLQQTGQMPKSVEHDVIYDSFAVTARDYFKFASEQHRAIDKRLAQRSLDQAEIDRLSALIKSILASSSKEQ